MNKIFKANQVIMGRDLNHELAREKKETKIGFKAYILPKD
jgi:hypothetical protein